MDCWLQSWGCCNAPIKHRENIIYKILTWTLNDLGQVQDCPDGDDDGETVCLAVLVDLESNVERGGNNAYNTNLGLAPARLGTEGDQTFTLAREDVTCPWV